MRFWVVELPRNENDGDGEDTRVWFTSRREAEKCYNQTHRKIARYNRAVHKAEQLQDTPAGPAARDRMQQLEHGFAHDGVRLACYELPLTRRALCTSLNKRFYNCREVVKG